MRSGYDAIGSGLLRGSGGIRRRQKRRKTSGWSDVSIQDRQRILKEVPDFEEDVEYTERQLLLLAEKILRADSKPPQEYPAVLFYEHMKDRWRREIYTSNGIPDPSIVQGIYWRTHPNGRKVNSDEQRKNNGASFYR